jgi:biopolymer transport protein ExbB
MAGDVASRDLRRHLQKAYPLAVVATVSPLLGLLGTVIGMIGAFDKVAAAGSLGDASVLGGDISKALITTGAGLTIAVPALVLYHYFKSRTNLYAIMLEEEVGELITEWYSAEADGQAKEGHDAGTA